MEYIELIKNKVVPSVLTYHSTFGQLIYRILYKKGSIDKAYLLLFAIPPFSIIPIIAIWLDLINDGDMNNPIDVNIILGMILLIFYPLIIYKLSTLILKDSFNDYHFMISIIVQLIIIRILFLIYKKRFNNICVSSDTDNRSNSSSTQNKSNHFKMLLLHVILIAPVVLILARLVISLSKTYFDSIDVDVNDIFDLSLFNNFFGDSIDNIDLIKLYTLISLLLVIFYVVLNMIYNNKRIISLVCNFENAVTANKEYDIKYKQLFIFGIILNIITFIIIRPNIISNDPSYDYNIKINRD